MAKGWIILHRQLLDCEIWDTNETYTKRDAWIELLLLANHSDKEIIFNGRPMTIGRGQYLTSVRKLSEKFNWSKDKVRRYLTLLESRQMITKDCDRNRTLLTIVNYGKYQDVRDSDKYSDKDSNKDTNKHSDKYADKTQTNNEKNEKNNNTPYNPPKEEPLYYPNDEALNDAFKDYVSMRKQTKNPMSDRAITLAMNKLKELSNGDNDLAIKILNQSVMWSWKGLYPLKEEEKKEPTGKRDLLKELWES